MVRPELDLRALCSRYGLAFAIAVLYLYSFPYFARIHHANELPRIYLAKAMIDDGTFAIDEGVKRWGATADVSPAHGHYYSNKAPGGSFLAAPVYLALKGSHALMGRGEPSLAEMTWTFRVATGVIPTLLFLLLMWRFLARFAPDSPRRLAIVGYALGSMAMTYSILFHAHQLGAICIASAYIIIVWVLEDGLDRRWLVVAGCAAGCAPLVDYQAAFAGVPVAVYLMVRAWQRRQPLSVVMAGAGAVPPIVLLLYYHAAAFGSPFSTGYDFSETFAFHHQVGFLGMDQLRGEAFLGSTIAPDNGLLFLCPMLLLAIPGWYLLARERRWWPFAITLAVTVIYLLFISSINFWRGGWQVGPRYITAVLPFMMVPVAVAIAAADRRWWLRGGSVGLVVVGVVIYALSCAEYPHFPEVFANPVFEVTMRLVGDGHAPYNLGYALGLRGLASLIPYLLILAGVLVYVAAPTRQHYKSALMGAAIATLVLIGYAQFDGGGKAADQSYGRIVAGDMAR